MHSKHYIFEIFVYWLANLLGGGYKYYVCSTVAEADSLARLTGIDRRENSAHRRSKIAFLSNLAPEFVNGHLEYQKWMIFLKSDHILLQNFLERYLILLAFSFSLQTKPSLIKPQTRNYLL
jgi:hypothetical protein